jgi:hypothetical protein
MTRRWTPSPAMIVAAIALIVALAGTGYAASHGGKNKVIRKVVRQMAPNLSVKHAATADNATHSGTADNAARSGTAADADAVGGQSVSRFSRRFPDSAGTVELLNFGGVRITGTCSGGNVGLSASNVAGQVAVLQAQWHNGITPQSSEDGDFGQDTISTIPGSGTGRLIVTFGNGTITTVTYAYQQSPLVANLPGAPGCGASGRAISG